MFEPLPTLANETIGVIVLCYDLYYLSMTDERVALATCGIISSQQRGAAMPEVLLLAGCWLEVGNEGMVSSRIGPMVDDRSQVASRGLHPAGRTQAMHIIGHDR